MNIQRGSTNADKMAWRNRTSRALFTVLGITCLPLLSPIEGDGTRESCKLVKRQGVGPRVCPQVEGREKPTTNEAHLRQHDVLLVNDAVFIHRHGQVLHQRPSQSSRVRGALLVGIPEEKLHQRTGPFVERQLGLKIAQVVVWIPYLKYK